MSRILLQGRPRQSWLCRYLPVLAAILMTVSVHAQQAGNARLVSISGKQLTLEEVFTAIRKQTGLTVFYNNRLSNDQDKVSLDFKSAPLEEVLKYVLKDRDMGFQIRRNQVIVLERKPTIHPAAETPSFSVSGRVTDTEGNALIGVTIKVAGTATGTSTGIQGEYILTGIAEDAFLDISYVGSQPQHIAVDKRPVINVKLQRATSVLDETVIMGYGTTTRRNNTGAISRVNSAAFEEQPVGNPLLAMQGKVPGMFINTTSGKPGANVSVQIRGRNSIGENSPYVTRNEPLYIVDGVPFFSIPLNQFDALGTPVQGSRSPLNSINPDDIESVEILKDGDATAIYGSKGANGVILITTRKAKRNGKLSVNANVYAGAGKVTNMLDMMNTEQYLQVRKEAFANDGVTPTAANAPDLLTWDQHTNTDWQKMLIGGTANVSNAQLSLSGGDAHNRFLLSSSYRHETTVYPGDARDNRIAVNASYDYTSTDNKFNLSFAANYSNDNDKSYSSDLANYYYLPPNYPLYRADGKLNWEAGVTNPMSRIMKPYNSNSDYLNSNVTMRYTILHNLQARVNLGYNQNSMDQYYASPTPSLDPSWERVSASFGNTKRKGFIIEPQVDYNINIGGGNLKALVGATWQKRTSDGYYITGTGYSSDETLNSMTGATTLTASSSYGNPNIGFNDYRYQSFFGRLTYDWKSRYVVNVTGRRDGSSRFAPEHRYGNFGAIGAAWIFSETAFFKDHFSFLSFGKLRASYGTTGNDMIGDYGYISRYVMAGSTYQGVAAISPEQPANKDYGWEKVAKTDIALETGFLDDRLLLNINFYSNRTSNQLVGYPLALITGFTGVQNNLPAVIRNNGWEFEVTSTNIKNKSFKWTTSFNLTAPQNKLVAYPGLSTSSYNNTYIIGEPILLQKGYELSQVDPKTGKVQFISTDWAKRIMLGSNLPSFYGGLQNTFRYKQWQLDMLLQFTRQEGWNYMNNAFKALGTPVNFEAGALDHWKKAGDVSNIPAPSTNNPDWYNYANSNVNWEDASFIRLKNIYLAYNMPAAWASRLKLSSCRLYLQGQNLFTITGYNGFDPETKGVFLPPLKMYTAGIQLSL